MWFNCFNRKKKSEALRYRLRAEELFDLFAGKLSCYIYGDMTDVNGLDCSITFFIIDGVQQSVDGTINYVGKNLYFEIKEGKLAFYSNNGRCPIYCHDVDSNTFNNKKKLFIVEEVPEKADMVFRYIEHKFDGSEIDVNRDTLENAKKLGEIVRTLTGMEGTYDKVMNEYKQC